MIRINRANICFPLPELDKYSDFLCRLLDEWKNQHHLVFLISYKKYYTYRQTQLLINSSFSQILHRSLNVYVNPVYINEVK